MFALVLGMAACGGDKRNVDIAGESAGGLSALYLMTSPSARGLFFRAIAQSSYMISMPELRKPVFGMPAWESGGALLTGALKSHRDSLAIAERLAAADPGNAEWQRDLSISLNKIGDVQSARGNLDAALKAYEDSRAIAEKLAAKDPSNSEWQRDLSVSFTKIGDEQEPHGDLEAALSRHDRLLVGREAGALQRDRRPNEGHQ